jgi:uncharacterized protein YdhG (YjbR/CyaY superfamily)
MKESKKEIVTIDDYIKSQEVDKQKGLQKIRALIKKAAPKATEVISYSMPAFKQDGVLVYFAAFKSHYGFYPTAKPIEIFKKQLDEKGYIYSKGAIQLPIGKPFSTKLIQDIVKYRIKEDDIKALTKKKKMGKK